jgi:hypothetical protein
VVFVIGARAGGQIAAGDFLVGFAIGVAGSLLVGALLYHDILRASLRHIFSVVTPLLAFLAAGLMAQAAGFLSSAGFLPPLVDEMWDTEDLLSQRIGIGQFLHALLGYMSQPSGIQLASYVVTCWRWDCRVCGACRSCGRRANAALPPPACVRYRVNAAPRDQDLRARFAKVGVAPWEMIEEELTPYVRAEHNPWGEVIRAAGIKAE